MKKTSDGIKIINRMIKDDLELQEMIRDSLLNAQVAQIIYDTRKKANLSQKQLADLIGIEELIIAELEDSDYEGNSLSMLSKIAEALNQQLEIKIVPRINESDTYITI